MAKYQGSLDEFERRYVRPNSGKTLIVGSNTYDKKPDRRALYESAVGVDMELGPGVDVVLDLEEPITYYAGAYRLGGGNFDHVECMSVLEHSRRPWLLAANLERLMVPGATIFVSVPWIWRYHAYPNDYFRFSPEGLKAIFPNIEWEHLMIASDKLREGMKVPAVKIGNENYPYLARAETVGFGRLKA